MASKVIAFFIMRLQLLAYIMIQLLTLAFTIVLLCVFMFLPLSALARWWEAQQTAKDMPKPDLRNVNVN